MKTKTSFDNDAIRLSDAHCERYWEGSRLDMYKLAWVIKSITPNTNWLLAVAETLQIGCLENLRQLAHKENLTYIAGHGPNSYEAPISEGVLARSQAIWEAYTTRYPQNFDLISVKVNEKENFFFYPMLILVKEGTPFEKALEYFKDLLNNDALWYDAQQCMYEKGRITLTKEQVAILGLQIGVLP